MANTTLDLTSTLVRRDLSDVLSTLIAQSPNFIGLFPLRTPATATKHEWLEDSIKPRQVAYSSATAAVASPAADAYFTFSDATKAANFKAGDIVRILGAPETYLVKSVSSANVTVEFYAQNGGSISATTSLPTGGGTLCYVNHAVAEASTSGQEVFHLTGAEYNYTQIFRRDVHISKTALEVGFYGGENKVESQVKNALLEITREINESLLFGKRVQRTASTAGGFGGLYAFGTSLEVDATPSSTASALSLKLINDAAEKILDAGGTPDCVICGVGQKRVLATALSSQINLTPTDKTRGAVVDYLISDVTGGQMRIVVEPQIPDTDCWVCDSSGFGLVPLGSRALSQTPDTPQGADYVGMNILGEYTAEFKNAAQRLCRIKELKASSLALA